MGVQRRLILRKEVRKTNRHKILKSAKTVKIVPGEMSDMDIDMISLVRKGANGQKIQIYKAEGEEAEDEEVQERGLLEALISIVKSFSGGGKVQKAADAVAPAKTTPKKTFASMMAVNDITENMWRANDTLRGVMRDIINNEEVTDKKAALLQAIDEYSIYMKNKVNSTAIAKEAAFFDVPDVEIEKSGKKVSSKNLAALKEAHKALSAVIEEAEKKDEPTQGGGSNGGDPAKEEETVNKTELTEVMKSVMESALKPINERLDKIEKADIESEGAGNEGGAAEASEASQSTDDDIAEVVKAAIAETLKPIESRLETIEKSRALPRSQEGDEGTKVEKSADVFDGLFA